MDEDLPPPEKMGGSAFSHWKETIPSCSLSALEPHSDHCAKEDSAALRVCLCPCPHLWTGSNQGDFIGMETRGFAKLADAVGSRGQSLLELVGVV